VTIASWIGVMGIDDLPDILNLSVDRDLEQPFSTPRAAGRRGEKRTSAATRTYELSIGPNDAF
jgi:hypothetical protein